MMTRITGMLLAILLAATLRPALAADPNADSARSPETRAALVEQGKKVFISQGCYGCHMVGTMGTPIGPDLSREGRKRTEAFLLEWLRDPASQKPTAHMPKIALAEGEVAALAAFLASLR
jgi:cytochrome c oxidase subunit 2